MLNRDGNITHVIGCYLIENLDRPCAKKLWEAKETDESDSSKVADIAEHASDSDEDDEYEDGYGRDNAR